VEVLKGAAAKDAVVALVEGLQSQNFLNKRLSKIMFQGIFVPHVTPFDSEEKVNEEVLRSLVHYFEEAGLDGLVTLGSNGEFPCLSFEEKVRVLEIVR
jgi:hypothetical protein